MSHYLTVDDLTEYELPAGPIATLILVTQRILEIVSSAGMLSVPTLLPLSCHYALLLSNSLPLFPELVDDGT